MFTVQGYVQEAIQQLPMHDTVLEQKIIGFFEDTFIKCIGSCALNCKFGGRLVDWAPSAETLELSKDFLKTFTLPSEALTTVNFNSVSEHFKDYLRFVSREGGISIHPDFLDTLIKQSVEYSAAKSIVIGEAISIEALAKNIPFFSTTTSCVGPTFLR